MTHQEFRDLFRMILAAWTTQRQRLSDVDIEAMAALYTAGLADLEYGVVKGAMTRLIRTAKWLPTVAEIREAAGVVVHGMHKTGGEAWGSVIRALREQGSHRHPNVDFTFNDPITARVVASLGWRELCSSDNQAADRARFIETYNQIAKIERVEAQASDGVSSTMLSGRVGQPESIEDATRRALAWHDDAPEPDEVQ